MIPQPSHREYGSVEDLSRSSRTLVSDDNKSSGVDRGSFDFDPLLSLRRGERGVRGGGMKRRFGLVVVGVLAVGVMLGLSHAGYPPLPKIFRKSDSRITGGPTLIDVTGDTSKAAAGEITPTAAEASTTAVQHPPLSPKPASSRTSTPLHEEVEKEGEELSPLSFTALNFYHERDGKPAQDYPWLRDVKLVEPHRETTLTVQPPRDEYEYRWKIYEGAEEAPGEELIEASGVEVVVVFTMLDDNFIVLEETDTNGRVSRRLEERVMVKYVRREIRTLTDEERNELLDAVREGLHVV